MKYLTNWNDIINKDNIIPASYIIYREGSMFYARSGKHGNIDFKGTDAATVIHSAQNNIDRGELYIKKGSYPITKHLALNNGVYVTGEGDGTKIELNQGISIRIVGGNNVKVSNLSIDGSNHVAYNYAIYIEDANNVIIDGVTIKDARGFGIYITANIMSDTIIIKNCILNGLGNNDIIGGGSIIQGSNVVTNVIIVNNVIKQDASQGDLYDAAIDIVGVYRTAFLNNITEGLIAFGSEKYPHKYSVISGNIIKNPKGKNTTQISAYATTEADINAIDLSFTNNTIENGHIEIIGVNTAYYIKGIISNNVVTGVRGMDHPISLKYCSQFVITGNMISNGVTGINLDSSTYTNVIGNIIADSMTGIDENSNCNYNMISGNIITNVTNKVVNISPTSMYFNNMGYITGTNILSETFDISSTGIKTINIIHNMDIIPNVQNCYLTMIENSPVDDWAYNLLKIVSTDKTKVVVKINISKASVTNDTTAKIALRIDDP